MGEEPKNASPLEEEPITKQAASNYRKLNAEYGTDVGEKMTR
jgi:hypothetical protein